MSEHPPIPGTTVFDGNQARAMDALGVGQQMFEVEGLDVRAMSVDPDTDPANLSDVAVEKVIAAVAEVPGMPDLTQMSLAELAGTSTATPVSDDDVFPSIGAVDADTGLYIPQNAGMPEVAPFGFWSDLPAPEFVIDGLVANGPESQGNLSHATEHG